MKKISLHNQIFIAMIIGLLAGFALNLGASPKSALFTHSVWWMDLIGRDLFIGALKMIIAPLILASIITGITTLPRAEALGQIGGKIALYYAGTTCVAVFIGVTLISLIQPGHTAASREVRAGREAELAQYRAEFARNSGRDPVSEEHRGEYLAFLAEKDGAAAATGSFGASYQNMRAAEDIGPLDLIRMQLLSPMLTNPFESLARANTLGIIFFSVLIGLACLVLGETAAPVVRLFSAMNDIIMKITLWIMEFSPLAIGCLMGSTMATLGFDALQSLAWYSLTIVLALALHSVFIVGIVSYLARIRPAFFLRGIRDAWMVAFSTASSAATLPVTIQCVTKELEVSEEVADFTLPVGATLNMDGSALHEAVAIMFLLQVYGGVDDVPVVLTWANTFVIAITAVIASAGVAAIPSAGLVALAIIAHAVGLPLHYIFLVLAVDRILDMCRTATNVMGDMAGATVVNYWEKKRRAAAAAP
ncbi:MAG: dicarboxylate/amino acid:cation symporter [Candidatus Hydrogenedentes bacterium]|nr:dicarboxylate/amino acid:cation symporter [Candidatus Hydrogenedentota bacterium]